MWILQCNLFVLTFLCSPQLFMDLLDDGIYACGTVQTNPKHLPQEVTTAKLKEQGESKVMQFGDTPLPAVAWKDKRQVTSAQTFYMTTSVRNGAFTFWLWREQSFHMWWWGGQREHKKISCVINKEDNFWTQILVHLYWILAFGLQKWPHKYILSSNLPYNNYFFISSWWKKSYTCTLCCCQMYLYWWQNWPKLWIIYLPYISGKCGTLNTVCFVL